MTTKGSARSHEMWPLCWQRRAASPLRRLHNRIAPLMSMGFATSSNEELAKLIVVDDCWREPDVSHEAEPSSSREDAEHVSLMDDTRGASLIAQQDREVDVIGRVVRIWVEDPLQKSHAAPGRVAP